MQIRGMDAQLTLMNSKTVLNTLLKEVLVVDSCLNAVYPNILSTTSDEVLRVEVVTFDKATEDEKYLDMSAVDLKLKVSLGATKLVFLNRYISKLLNFISEFETAKEKIAEASVAAAEVAKHGMEEAYQKATRVSLDIHLKAPIIIMPQNFHSETVLIADLGTLKLFNAFTMLNISNDCGIPAIFDNLCLEFSDLKLSTAIVNTVSGKILAESMLLEPINLKLEVVRNLAIGWYMEVPEVAVKGNLAAVRVILSQEDITIIMKFLVENLGDAERNISSSEYSAKASVVEKHTSGKKISVNEHMEDKRKHSELIESVFKRMTFAFQLDSFKACLYEGSSNLTSGLSERKPECSLAQFELVTITIKGEILSDSSFCGNVILVNCILDDKRSIRKKGITRLMDRVPVKNDTENMIDITFRQDLNLDKFLFTKISSFNLVLNVDYLMILGDFFVKAMPENLSPQPTTTAVPETPDVTDHADAGPFGCTSINLNIKEPDLILIEDMEDFNSNAIILKFKMDAKMMMSPNSQSVSGVISHLQLFTACFNPELRANTMSEILRPCDITLYSYSPNMKGQHVNIDFTSIFLNVSPNTISIFMNILSSLASQKSSKELDEAKSSEEYSKLWTPKKLEECSFWFLENIGFAEEAVEDVIVCIEDKNQMKVDSELFMLNMNTITLTVETGVGIQTVPMVMMEASFQAQVQNWNSNLHLKSVFSMEIVYFNEKLAVWEPLVEPVKNASGRSEPWKLLIEITKNSELPEASTEDIESIEISLQPPVMRVNICSSDVMELMVSKVALEVLTHLGHAFGEAVKQAHKHKYIQPEAPYVVKNHLGTPMSVILANNIFQVVGQDHFGFKEVILEPNSSVYLKLISSAKEESTTSILIKQNVKLEEALCIKIETDLINTVRNINISHVGKRYFQLPLKTYPGDQWGFVVDVASLFGSKIITFQSCITVRSDFSNPMELYYMRPGGNELEMCGVLEPEKTFFVPLYGVYTPTSQFFFKPNEGSFSVCTEPFVWKDLMSEPSTSKILQCTSHSTESRNLFFKVFGNVEQVYFERSMKKTLVSTCYALHIRPTASLRNLLPFTIRYTIQGVNEEFVLEEGFTHDLVSAYPGKTYLQIKLPNYLERKWVCCKEINHTVADLSIWTFSSNVLGSELSLDLGMHTRKSDGYLDMEIYCPFWMINKTNLLLTYKGEQHNITTHPGSLNAPLLFSFRAKNFFSKKKASLKVENSEWSDEFAVDAVGSSGSIAAKIKDGKTYCLGVQIMLGQTSLNKIVVFTPFYMLMNNSKFDIQVKENLESAQWVTVFAGECAAFWPDQRKNMEMLVRYANSENQTAPFSFKEPHSSLLRLGGLNSAIYVDCQVGESSTVLTFCNYYEGSAQVRLINHTDSFTIEYFQCGKNKKVELVAQHCILYVWEDPMGERELLWSCGNKINGRNNLIEDGIGEFFADKDSKIYWVSFLDGLQRTLIFTEDIAVATAAQEAGELERIEQEITVSLQGVGISLVDSERRSEIVYMSLANSGVLWEQRKFRSHRFKPVSLRENVILEEGYQKYLRETQIRRKPKSKFSLEGKLEVDFDEMIMYKPKKSHIRRSFQLGIWAQYSSSPHQLQLHAKINKLQIDNQLVDCVFPVVLVPVPLPKSVAADSAPKPFTEISIMMRKTEHSSLNQFKYFKVLIQEFQVKLDQSFLNSLISFFSPKEPAHINHKELLEKDKVAIKKDLKGFATIYSSQDQKSFYDILHFSPIKIHLSFSMTGGGKHTNQRTAIHSDFINLLLQSVGVTVTEIQDVIFKLNYFEKQNAFLTQRQLISDATMHYTGQALKQLYMLVLGLDVIGNPVGLLLGITEGVGDFFYEPFQGAIQGPEEFAEGLAIGVKSLLGHAVGGTAGAVSRITGTLGKGLAALTMDQEYQKKRRQQMNKQPEDVAQGLAQGGKGIIMGVFEGVTGVVTKPVTGAKEEGIGGFFKGIGKGLIGVVARPTGGVVDFASSGLEAVKKITELSDEVKRTRCPRYIHPDTVIKPYHRIEAEGNQLLQETEKGRFVTTDEYIAHLPLGSEDKSYLLVTSRRVMYISQGDVFGQCNTEWQIVWNDIRETPQITEKGIKFMLKEPRKKKLGGLLRNEETGKLVYISDPKLCAWIVGKVEEAMKQCI
ncbi:vacuolar protein sorting-associated protein 13C-like [Limulus polyphemus]|uniref:Vacuolar protein sorting-associated protein 13C-like n=1 Tax=Limulus polyphemus TaxID=6850 RepID=A0ABM1TIG2_LIMPO|nr:vacuolar protein sorting-associated protein 13C-like [Limulus polyphemus]